jgi:signal transduction histidine kinase
VGCLLLPWRILTLPFRLYRRKISVQLIASHVLVVLLTILLIEVAVLAGIVIGYNILRAENTDYAIGQLAQSTAVVLSADEASADLARGAVQVPPAERAELQTVVDQLVRRGIAIQGTTRVNLGSQALATFGNVGAAAITDSAGTVVASSDPDWAAPGQPVSAARVPLVSSLTERAIELGGAPTVYGQTYVIDNAGLITVAAHAIMRDGKVVGVVTIQGDPPELPAISATPEIIWGVIGANAVLFTIILIPALLVSVPVGIWRARAFSKRLSRLADAATSMASGDLSTRVPVKGSDEVTQVSQRFNEMVDRMEETDRNRKAFVANVSHELRTPVAIIQGNVERLLEQPEATEDPERQARSLAVIRQETSTLTRLIDDLFTMARIEETSLPLQTVPVNLHDIVTQVVEGISPVAWSQRKVSVQSVVSADLPAVLADPTRLRQILGNLLYNALRHTPEGGLIVVNAERGEGGVVRVSVSDTGVGMTSDEVAHVFERFYQVERSGRNAEGSGLGLTIVRELVEAQGGTIDVQSELGQGTTFTFTVRIMGDG